jgi:hypothetical protein
MILHRGTEPIVVRLYLTVYHRSVEAIAENRTTKKATTLSLELVATEG